MRWEGRPSPPPRAWTIGDRWRIAWKGAAAGAVLAAGLAALVPARLAERALRGAGRPWTPWIVQGVCRAVLGIIGLRRVVRGAPMAGPGAMVANHASWLDVFALHAAARVFFVAKAEVAGWPGVGLVARAAGTAFIARRRAEAGAQRALFERRLAQGHRLLFFPEGTSTDGRRVLAFKSSLFEAFLAPGTGTGPGMRLQAVTVAYRAPPGEAEAFFGWWGEMALGPSLAAVLARGAGGVAEMAFHPPMSAAEAGGRKALARALEAQVRTGLEAALSAPPR